MIAKSLLNKSDPICVINWGNDELLQTSVAKLEANKNNNNNRNYFFENQEAVSILINVKLYIMQ